mgnify:CR=1 FL=1
MMYAMKRMLMRTPKNILMHELIGLGCRVVESKNMHCVGIEGRIIDEGMKTVVLKTASGRKTIMKKDTVFRLDLGRQKVDVDGNFIIARPEDRIKKRFKKW